MQITDLDTMFKDLSKKKVIAFDLETVGLDPQFPRASIICISLCGEEGKPYVILWDHPDRKIPKEDIKECLDKLFAQERVWVAHNGKFDCAWLDKFGFTVPAHSHDTIIMAHLLDENQPKNVESVASRYLRAPRWGQEMGGFFNAVTDALRTDKPIPYPPVETLVEYAGMDTDIEFRLFHTLWPKMDRGLRRVHDFLMDVSWVLEDVESIGVYMDAEKLSQAQDTYEEQQEGTIKVIQEETGELINPNSTQQLGKLLFETLNLPMVEFTEKGAASTGEHVLKTLRRQAPVVVNAVIDYRRATKYVGSYIKPWRSLLNEHSRLRSSFNITGTVTGRLSCQNQSPWRSTSQSVGMSLHQVPRDGEIRRVVTAPPGRVLVVADYSQIELRVAAALAKDQRMLRAYANNEDIHRLTASVVTGKPLEHVTDEDRQRAKAVNFGFLYGMGAKNFVKYAFDEYDLEFTEQESQQIRRSFFSLYRGLLPWHRSVEETVIRQGFIRSPLGRIRRLPDVHSSERGLRYAAVRQAINSPVQATASDFTLMAMVLSYEYALDYTPEAFLLGQVHDSILFEVPENDAEDLAIETKAIMEHDVPDEIKRRFGYAFPVPLGAEVVISHEWGGKPIKVLA